MSLVRYTCLDKPLKTTLFLPELNLTAQVMYLVSMEFSGEQGTSERVKHQGLFIVTAARAELNISDINTQIIEKWNPCNKGFSVQIRKQISVIKPKDNLVRMVRDSSKAFNS